MTRDADAGVEALVDRCCELAQLSAKDLDALGAEVLNDVVLNQVLFRFADDALTEGVLASVQQSGEAWMGGTVWQGRPAIRLSVSNWQTTADDVNRTVESLRTALESKHALP